MQKVERMKRGLGFSASCLVVGLLLGGVVSTAHAQSSSAASPGIGGRATKNVIVGPLRTQWEMTEELVMNIARIIPESLYDYRPTPEVRSFRELLTHIASENLLYIPMVAGEPPKDRSKIEALQGRDEILKALQESYDYGEKTLANLTDETAADVIDMRGRRVLRWYAVLYNIWDNMDHYGNLVVYVRMNKMTPPRPPAGSRRRRQQ
jgi:uncharacterized damage-inducible protein DinB